MLIEMKVERIGKSLQGENDVVLRNMQKGINTVGSTRLMIRLVKIKTSYAKWKTQKRNTHKCLTIGPACVGQWPLDLLGYVLTDTCSVLDTCIQRITFQKGSKLCDPFAYVLLEKPQIHGPQPQPLNLNGACYIYCFRINPYSPINIITCGTLKE